MEVITVESLRATTVDLLEIWGVPSNQADIIVDTVVYAHTHEKHTHGITRMSVYRKKMDEGYMPADTQLTTKVDAPALAVLQSNNGFGQVAAYHGMKLAMEKAKNAGMGAVFISDSNNFGVTGYFGELAANEGMAGIVITSSGPAVAPPGGEKSVFGTNPICCAFPAPEGNIVLDMAVSQAARGKVRLAEKNGEKIPFGWAVDKDGNPTDDPSKALEGNMLPIGGVKGFGLAMVVDILAGLLSGSAFGGNIKPLAAHDGFSRHGHMCLALDIRQMMELEEYEKRISELVANVKACGQPGAVQLPGERSAAKAKHNQNTVLLNNQQVDDYNRLAEKYHVYHRLIVSEV